jgi:hypothetical protein
MCSNMKLCEEAGGTPEHRLLLVDKLLLLLAALQHHGAHGRVSSSAVLLQTRYGRLRFCHLGRLLRHLLVQLRMQQCHGVS